MQRRRAELFPRYQGKKSLQLSFPGAESRNLRTRQEGVAMQEVRENNAQRAKPRGTKRLPGPLTRPPPTPTPRGPRTGFTLMMLLRRGVARAASKRPASLSAGDPAATGNTTPLRRSLDRPPRAAATPSPEAPAEPTRGSSSPPAASGGGGPSLPAAPSAMAGRVSGSRGRLHARQRSPAAGHRCAHAPGGGPAGLCFIARRRRRRQLSGEEASFGPRRPRALVQEVGSPLRDGSGAQERGEAKRKGRCPKCDADTLSARNKRHRAPGRAASEAGTRAA